MTMTRNIILLFFSAALAACAPMDSAFLNRGGPESLLDVSSEVVNLGVESPQKLSELVTWIAKDQPTRAELYCTAGTPACNEAVKVLELNAVPTMMVPSGDNIVALVYERIVAHDCNQRFTDDTHDMYNAPHPAFGCAVSANIVQHVSNKQQFIAPNVMDAADAAGGVAAHKRAYAPKAAPKTYGVGDSLSSKSGTGD